MQDHQEWFEMAPPTMFSVTGARFLATGKESRDDDVTPEIRQHVLDYCRRALGDCVYPAALFYRDLAPSRLSIDADSAHVAGASV